MWIIFSIFSKQTHMEIFSISDLHFPQKIEIQKQYKQTNYIHTISNIMDSVTYKKLRYEQLPWTEKYRPVKLNDLVLDESLDKRVKQLIVNKTISNLIITGSPGIGKTSTVMCIARELYGPHMDRGVLELNASDGIKSMLDVITNFCKTKLIYPEDEAKKYSNQKLIILDEADNMIDRTQPQLNNIMESYKNIVKFAFTCNSSSNISEAIQSRCLILRYTRMTDDLVIKRLSEILDNESIKYNKSALKMISGMARGDMRFAINMIQLIANRYDTIKLDYVYELCDMPQQIVIKKLFDAALKNDLLEAFSVMNELRNSGYSGSDITLGMMHTLKSDICSDISEKNKIAIFQAVCKGAYRISKGTDSLLQLSSCIVDVLKVANPKKVKSKK